jgi:hypothetical protein
MARAYELEKTELQGTEPIQDLIDLTIRTPYVKHERVCSLLIVSEPEAGKTEIIKKFCKNRGVHPRRRFTAYGITTDLLSGQIKPLFNQPKILGHILVYDYSSVFSYKANVVDSTIEFLDALTEEGLAPESSYWIKGNDLQSFEGLKGGLIAGINTFSFFTSGGKVKANLYKGGWLSRNLVCTYDISETLLTKIFDSIGRGEYREGKGFVDYIILQLPMRRIDIELRSRHSIEIGELARELAEDYTRDLQPYKLKGLRLNKSLVSLVKASALRENRDCVNSDDVERIRYLSQWMNLKMNHLKTSYPYPVREVEG